MLRKIDAEWIKNKIIIPNMASSHNIIEKTLHKGEICQNQRLYSKNKHKII
jgi:hypothetical protein